MKRYAISYIDWFDNELKMATTNADSEIEALYNCAAIFHIDIDINIANVDDFQAECFNMDCMMAALEI